MRSLKIGARIRAARSSKIGRVTPSVRQRITKTMNLLRRKYRASFKDDLMQVAFEL